jgi:hypothetical protein
MQKFIVILIASIIVCACATPGLPEGGPKDVTPPKIKKTLPEDRSIFFTGNKIALYFDELVELKDVNSQLVVSPPLKYRPDIKSLGKYINVIIKDTLQSNTTYTFNFADAIVDNNEGNPIKGYSFTFSTGEVIDSLHITGKVIDALTQDAKKGVTVLLLDSVMDVMYKHNIRAIAKSDDQGDFMLVNLPDKPFYIVALEDANKDNRYDTIQDAIAFLKEKVSPKILIPMQFPDSCSSQDSVAIIDSIRKLNDSEFIVLGMFKQKLQQTILKSEFINNTTFSLNFRNTSILPPSVAFINPVLEENQFQIEWKNKNQDATIFLPIDTVYKSVQLALSYNGKIDSLKITNDKLTKNSPARESILARDSISLISDSIVMDTVPVKKLDTLPPIKQDNFAKIQFNLISEMDLSSVIFQVLDTKNAVVEESIYLDSEHKTIVFDTLKPSSYKFRLIFDENFDQEWTPGNVFENLYPEKVLYFDKTVKMDKGWEYEEDWSF